MLSAMTTPSAQTQLAGYWGVNIARDCIQEASPGRRKQYIVAARGTFARPIGAWPGYSTNSSSARLLARSALPRR